MGDVKNLYGEDAIKKLKEMAEKAYDEVEVIASE